MDIDQLRTFVEVARTRHFGQAAHNLFVTQSAVSARIRALENAVGTALFARNRNKVQLTAAGERLLRYAENILLTWNQARQDLVHGAEGRPPLAVGGAPSLWDTLLHDWLVWLVARQPALGLRLEVLEAARMHQRVVEGTLDLAFVFDFPPAADCAARQVASLALILVASRPRLSAEEAVRGDYVRVDWGASFAVAHAQRFPELGAPRLHMALGRMAWLYIRSRGGAAYLPRPLVAEDLAAGRLHEVRDAPVFKRPVFALTHLHSDRQPLVEEVLKYFDWHRRPAGAH